MHIHISNPPLGCGGFYYDVFFSYSNCFCYRDFCFHSLDHLGKFDFALVAGFSVDVEFLVLAVRQSWEEAAFPEVVVYLIQASGAAFSYLSRDRLGMRLKAAFGVFCLTAVYPTSTHGAHGNSGGKSAGKDVFPSGKGAEMPKIERKQVLRISLGRSGDRYESKLKRQWSPHCRQPYLF